MKFLRFPIALLFSVGTVHSENIEFKPLSNYADVELRLVSKDDDANRIRKKFTALAYARADVDAEVAKAKSIAVVTMRRNTIGAANLDNFAFILMDDKDQVISREKGTFNIPETPSGSDRRWWNLHIVRLAEFEQSIKLRVVDMLRNESSEFLIYKPDVIKAAETRLAEQKAAEREAAALQKRYAKNPAAAQADAVKRFPELAVQGSPIHSEFMNRLAKYRESNSALLLNPAWPVILAEDSADAIRAKR